MIRGMRINARFVPAAAMLAAACASPAAAAGRPITINDLLAMERIADPQISADGSRVLYTVAVPDVPANRSTRTLWVVPIAGGDAKTLTSTALDEGGRWSPDGRRIAYISSPSGTAQLWSMNADGSSPHAIASLSGDIDNIVWSPDGRTIAFTSEVYPDCPNDACNAARDKAREQNKVKARVYDRLESQSKGRFRTLVTHAGVYDLTSMYGATEELWFPEHEFGGPPWASVATYQRLSPHTYAAEFGKYKTPTLVIAGELDFRVPYTQSLEFHTALQRQGVPSRLILFPDEGHWVLKPQNSAFWYTEVLAWLDRYLGPKREPGTR
jgi:dipeptidyl aminopeptidase/acylaminoacyl peptidase